MSKKALFIMLVGLSCLSTSGMDTGAARPADVVDISGLDKAEVLRALYARAKPLGFGVEWYVPGDLAYDDAVASLAANRGYVDYLKGRVIKVDLSGNELRTRLFNRDNGAGAAESVIAALRGASEKK